MIRLKLLLTVLLLTPWLLEAQKVKSFNGIDALQLSAPPLDIDPNGAVGTKQYLEWVNNYYQGYDKVTFAPVWSAVQNGATPFLENNMPNCKIAGDGLVMFDRMALRWIIAGHTGLVGGKYYYCVAISNTDDLAATNFSWYTYQFLLNPVIGVNSGVGCITRIGRSWALGQMPTMSVWILRIPATTIWRLASWCVLWTGRTCSSGPLRIRCSASAIPARFRTTALCTSRTA